MENEIKDLINLTIKLQSKYFNKQDISLDLSELAYKLNNLSDNLKIYKEKIITENFSDEKTPDEINKVAYFLARYEHKDLTKKRITKAIEEFSLKLGVKPSTLRNKRDTFAPLVYDIKDNELKEAIKLNPKLKYKEPRNGWKIANRELTPALQETYDECKNKSHDELLAEVKSILGMN